jgi:hypothetical protein
MNDIAEDTRYSFEYVINSYIQYRKGVRSYQEPAGKTSSIDISALLCMKLSSDKELIGLADGKDTKEPTPHSDASKPVGQQYPSGERHLEKSEQTGPERILRCAIQIAI